MSENNDNHDISPDPELEEIVIRASFPRRVARGVKRGVLGVGRRLKKPVLFVGFAAAFGAGAYLGWDAMQGYMLEETIYKSKHIEEVKVDRYGRLVVREYHDEVRILNPDDSVETGDEQSSDKARAYHIRGRLHDARIYNLELPTCQNNSETYNL